jgi:allophanate hydrolase
MSIPSSPPGPSTASPSFDIGSLHEGYRRGEFAPVDIVEEAYRRIAARGEDHVWLALVPREAALRRASELAREVSPRTGPDRLPLYGLPFSVKDNIHVAGMPTSAACPAYAHVATSTATAVTRAFDDGALLIGKTNLDQFATGLVGIRCPTGYCRNPFHPDYIPGGSSSGAGVSVSAGLVSFAFGSDTGGSGRVPAALTNTVGFKPTPGVISVSGFVYANRSIDVCPIFTLTVDDAYRVFEAVRGYDADDIQSRADAADYDIRAQPFDDFRIGSPAADQLNFFGDSLQAASYEQALVRIRNLGGSPVAIDFEPFVELGRMLFDSPMLAERLVDMGELALTGLDTLHPATRAVVSKALGYSAADAHRALYRVRELSRAVNAEMSRCDVLAVPTTGTIYRIDEVEADPLRLNSNNGYYTYFANLAALSAIAVPAGMRPDGLPFGLCLLAPAYGEGALRGLARRFHRESGLNAGATRHPVAPMYMATRSCD